MNSKQIVLPGEKVFDSPVKAEGCFTEGGKTFASIISVMQEDKIIPLKGRYLSKYGDYVIGIVKEERFSGYTIDLNSPYDGSLSTRDTREEYQVGNVVSAKVIDVNEMHESTLSESRLLYGGEILEIEPVKVPRVIGRGGSMLEIIEQYTKSSVFVGKNGRIYLKGANTALASLAIIKICRESHVSGLTDRMTEFLQKEASKNGGIK